MSLPFQILVVLASASHAAAASLSAQTGGERVAAEVRIAMIGAGPGSAIWPAFEGRWLALHRTAKGDRLEPVTAALTIRDDPCRGRDTIVTMTGLPAGAKVPFLIQWSALKPGPVDGTWKEPRFLYPGEELPIGLGGRRWFNLAAYGIAEPGMLYNYRLVLGRAETRQTIAQLHVVSMDGPPHVVWAGDLDRDGRPDLLADLTTDYAGHMYVLYVSSLAPTGQLVVEATRFAVASC